MQCAGHAAADGCPGLEIGAAQELVLREERQVADRCDRLHVPTHERLGLVGQRYGDVECALGRRIRRQTEPSAGNDREAKTGFDGFCVHCSMVVTR